VRAEWEQRDRPAARGRLCAALIPDAPPRGDRLDLRGKGAVRGGRPQGEGGQLWPQGAFGRRNRRRPDLHDGREPAERALRRGARAAQRAGDVACGREDAEEQPADARLRPQNLKTYQIIKTKNMNSHPLSLWKQSTHSAEVRPPPLSEEAEHTLRGSASAPVPTRGGGKSIFPSGR
jgi:hypothetical protein